MEQITYETRIKVYQPTEITAEFIPLIDEAKLQTQKSYALYSGFKVGAAIMLANGIVVGGNNQENSAYPSGLCATPNAPTLRHRLRRQLHLPTANSPQNP